MIQGTLLSKNEHFLFNLIDIWGGLAFSFKLNWLSMIRRIKHRRTHTLPLWAGGSWGWLPPKQQRKNERNKEKMKKWKKEMGEKEEDMEDTCLSSPCGAHARCKNVQVPSSSASSWPHGTIIIMVVKMVINFMVMITLSWLGNFPPGGPANPHKVRECAFSNHKYENLGCKWSEPMSWMQNVLMGTNALQGTGFWGKPPFLKSAFWSSSLQSPPILGRGMVQECASFQPDIYENMGIEWVGTNMTRMHIRISLPLLVPSMPDLVHQVGPSDAHCTLNIAPPFLIECRIRMQFLLFYDDHHHHHHPLIIITIVIIIFTTIIITIIFITLITEPWTVPLHMWPKQQAVLRQPLHGLCRLHVKQSLWGEEWFSREDVFKFGKLPGGNVSKLDW